uniref:Uncharacterized protein n=1 Tax=Anguilla anguilla TaxID=7936 RepID=A0A0E9VYS9_ANGAN
MGSECLLMSCKLMIEVMQTNDKLVTLKYPFELFG